MDEVLSAGVCFSGAEEVKPSFETQASSSIHFNGLNPPVRFTPPSPESSRTAAKSASSPARMESEIYDNNGSTPNMGRRLRSRSEVSSVVGPDLVADAMKPITDEERRDWPGWVELESDPALFNFILREYGVKNIKIQEVLGLESALLDMLPQPVYGLIFLFKYRDEEVKESDETLKCPRNVWFANQTINNACATIALLNIVMNVPEIDLGKTLSAFKAETNNLKPPYRGKMLGTNAFIRNIHNSFARRMDILDADLSIYNDMQKWEKAKKCKYKRRRVAKKKKSDENEPGFHFIAYVPIDGAVWKLDGLQRQPHNLGSYQGEDWMSVAIPNINEQMFKYQTDSVQFNLLSLCRSPLHSCPEKLAENFHAINMIKKVLEAVQPDWQQFTQPHDANIITGPTVAFSISQELIDKSSVPEEVTLRIKNAEADSAAAINLYQELVSDQLELQQQYWDEMALVAQEDAQADRRRHDYTSLIYDSIRTLSEKGVLRDIVDDIN